jgi:hypothetical protein
MSGDDITQVDNCENEIDEILSTDEVDSSGDGSNNLELFDHVDNLHLTDDEPHAVKSTGESRTKLSALMKKQGLNSNTRRDS